MLSRKSADSILWWTVAAAVVVIPFVVTYGADIFRLPRELLLDAAAIAVTALTIVAAIWSRTEIPARLAQRRRVLIIVAAIVVWTAVTTLTSTVRVLSVHSLIWVVCCAAFFLVALGAAAGRPLWSVWLAVVPAALISIVAMLQRAEIWTPFLYERAIPVRLRTTGLFGNPNDLGVFLVLPGVAALVLATVTRGVQRVAAAAAAVVIFAGIAASETLTAVAAAAAAIFALAIFLSRRAALGLAVAATIAVAVTVVVNVPVISRIKEVMSEVLAGQTYKATSLRSQAMHSAALMAKEHPLTGVGPGCYGYWYLPYKMELVGDHPEYMHSEENFHEAHSDHLQVLATMGLPGYIAFLAALWQVAWISLQPPAAGGARALFAKRFGFPVAAAFFVLALAQFPLELAAPTLEALFLAAVTLAWSRAT